MIDVDVLIALIGGYLLGGIPFGLVLTKAAGLGDIRTIGSGNIGATNVLRTGNKPIAAATLLLDGGKGAIAALAAGALLGRDPALAAGVAAVFGHNFPVWLRFKGGKGVATALGALIAISWPAGLGACATWLLVAATFRFSSLSSLVAVAAAPAYAWFLGDPRAAAAAAFLTALVWLRHIGNIKRLMQGEEPKIGKKRES